MTRRPRRNPPPDEMYARRWLLFTITAIGPFLAYLDVTIVNVAIPELQRDLNADVPTVSWVINAYTIAFAVPMVAMGRLADQYGRRRFLLAGLSTFALGSLLCALAPSIGALTAARVLQGVGASVLTPLALATTVMIFPPERRGFGIALQGILGTAGAVLGPPVGGVVLEYASWHWIFALNVPIAVGGLVFALRFVPETFDLTAHERVDAWGIALLGGSVFALSFALVRGNALGWGSMQILGLFAASALLAAGFVLSQRLGRFPMIHRTLAANRRFLAACVTNLSFSVASMGVLFLLVLGMVELWGYSELEAAMATLAVPLGALAAVPLVAWAADRLAPRAVIVPGLLLAAVSIYWLGSFPSRADYPAILPAVALAGFGIGLALPAVTAGAMIYIRGQELGVASGVLYMSRQIGIAVGVAVAAATFTAALEDRLSDARREVAAVAERSGESGARANAILDATAEGGAREEIRAPRTPAERTAAGLSRESARDAFGVGFRVAALAALLTVPFALILRRFVVSEAPEDEPASAA